MNTKYIRNKLKNIFNTSIIHEIVDDFKKNFFSQKHINFLLESIDKFIACRDLQKGYVSYKCETCNVSHLFALTCKSKLCPACGYKYSQAWAKNIKDDILNIPHRHVLFTIPDSCREFFFYDRNLLTKLSGAVNEVFKYSFHNISKKNQRVNKILASSSKYFTDSDIVHYGLITVIHTFGRDLKWNPHIHAIVSLGGFNKKLEYKKRDFFNAETIAGQWKHHVLNIISEGNYPDEKIRKKALKVVSELYKKETRFFFNVGDGNVNSKEGIIKYLGRYLARSPIAEYKITDISEDEVTFFFHDLKNGKKEAFVTMKTDKFIKQVLIHLPPKNFKTVNRYGFYARNINKKLKIVILKYKNFKCRKKISFYAEQNINTFGVNPFYCPICNKKMKVCEFYHYKYSFPTFYT